MEWEIIEDVLASGNSVEVRVRGVSMYPHFFSGDILQLVPASTPTKGDCYLVARGNQYRIHRCQNASSLEFRGDNLDSPDASPDRILALVAKRRFTAESVAKRAYYFFARRLHSS